uniref:Uncharacterized protein n=1 Tax=Knipowitschia caucasica TaxID=637954 RepID=A0AAV2JF30_KNICA
MFASSSSSSSRGGCYLRIPGARTTWASPNCGTNPLCSLLPRTCCTMSKSSTLRVKNLFKSKSLDKESKDAKKAASKDGVFSSPVPPVSLPTGPGDLSTLPVSPREKKSKGMFSLKLKRKKSKQKAEDVFFMDSGEDSFSPGHM